jgi:hypothetical protein
MLNKYYFIVVYLKGHIFAGKFFIIHSNSFKDGKRI